MNEERVYLLTVKILSSGNEERGMTPYDDVDTAERKWHEAFNTIGGGPKFISAEVVDKYWNVVRGLCRYWKQEEPEPNEE